MPSGNAAVILLYVSLLAKLCSRYSFITCKTSDAVLDKALYHNQNIRMPGLTTKVVIKNKKNKSQINKPVMFQVTRT